MVVTDIDFDRREYNNQTEVGDEEKVNSSLLLFIQHLHLLILVLLLSLVAGTDGFDVDKVEDGRRQLD